MGEDQTQINTNRTWWLGVDRKWHDGDPPKDWHKAHDRRWYPPNQAPKETPVGEDPTEEMEIGPLHRAPRSDDEEWTAGKRLAAAALFAALCLVVAGLWVAENLGGGESTADAGTAPEQPSTTFPPAGSAGSPLSSDSPDSAASTANDDSEESTTTGDDPDAPTSSNPPIEGSGTPPTSTPATAAAPTTTPSTTLPSGVPANCADDLPGGRHSEGWYLAYMERHDIVCD